MPTCRKCNEKFPVKIEINEKVRNLQNRKYCLKCSPFGSGNTRKLEKEKQYDKKTKKRIDKKRNNEKYKKWQRKARKERKRKLVDLLGGRCQICGYNKCLSALEFHHKDEKNHKSFGIGVRGLLTKWNVLLEEIKKCKLVCANCHREIHENERGG